MAKAGFWLKGARGKLNGATIKGAAGGGTIISSIVTPTNPKTAAQTNTRAKFKLISQLGAVMKDVIAIKREGAVSGRNLFSKINSANAQYSEGVASIDLNKVQLTKSNISLGGFNADRSGDYLAVALDNDRAAQLDSVVYIQFEKQDDGSLQLIDSVAVTEAGEGGNFPAQLMKSVGSIVVYAYGAKAENQAASEKFGNIEAPTAERVAQLIVSGSISAGDLSLTKTAGLTMEIGDIEADSEDMVMKFTITANKKGNGSVSGGGRYPEGAQCTLIATPDSEASFVAWRLNTADGQILSTNPTYSFTVSQALTIVGVFQGGPVPQYTIAASANPADGGSIAGAGQKAEDSTCTLTATPEEGKQFEGWYEDGQKISAANPLSFTVDGDRTLVARFIDIPTGGFSNVTFNGQDFNSNKNMTGNDTIAGNFVGADATMVGFVGSRPQVGATVTIAGLADKANIENEEFSIHSSETTDSLYLIAMHSSGGAQNQYIVDAVYDYYLRGEQM